MSENLLIVFVKYPAPGTVKLRLAQHIGAETAAAVYRQIAEAVIKNTVPYSAAGYTVEICFSPQDAETLLREWLSDNRLFYPQKGSDLGARMLNAFEYAFDSGYRKAILIGSDCPDISEEIVLQGFSLLDKKEVVLGPAYDGGYYLIGLKQPRKELFQNIAWGTDNVFQMTCDKIISAGVSFALLPALRDVDRVEDLKYYSFLELSVS
jgi:hypothetical protein